MQLDCLVVIADRLVVFLSLVVSGASIVVGRGIIRFQLDRFVVIADRLFVIFLINVGNAAGKVIGSVIGVNLMASLYSLIASSYRSPW